MTEQPHRPDGTKPSSSEQTNTGTGGVFARFLSIVEWLGNCLPHPVTLFALFVVLVALVSALGAALGWAVVDPRPEGSSGRAADGMIRAVSLLSRDGIQWITGNLVTNFSGFAPLGTVLVALLGVGVAEKSGLLGAAIRGLVLAAPRNLVTVVVVLAGVLSNTASEMGYVVLIPLAMVVFHAMGRHPFAGLAAAFAGVSGGYSANLLIGTVDPLLAGITQEAVQFLDEGYQVNPAANWFFMIASVPLIVTLGSLVTAKIVEPRLGRYDPSNAAADIEKNPSLERLSPAEWRALRWAGVACLGCVVLFTYAAGPFYYVFEPWLPYWGVLRDMPDPVVGVTTGAAAGLPDDVQLIDTFRPFLSSVVAMIFVFFVIPGFVYGRVAGTMKNDRDVIDAMAGAMSSMGLYIVLVFFAAQFVEFFKYSNLGGILAVVGADGIRALGLDNPLVFLPFILMCCFVNLMLGSASAQWAVTAPIFVPMLMNIGYSPEVIQAAYRIGDSTTNIITPMMSYFGLILAMATRYDKKLGIGTLVATMLPYSLLFIVGWTLLFYLWVFVLGLPVGPGSPTTYVLPGAAAGG